MCNPPCLPPAGKDHRKGAESSEKQRKAKEVQESDAFARQAASLPEECLLPSPLALSALPG